VEEPKMIKDVLKVEKEIVAVEKACSEVLETHTPTAIPRVKLRQARPVFQALADMIQANEALRGIPAQALQVMLYPIGPGGTRVSSMNSAECYGIILVDKNQEFFWTTISTPIATVEGYVSVSMGGTRRVSVEDLSELDIDVIDIVKSIKDSATTVLHSIALMDVKALPNMPAASA